MFVLHRLGREATNHVDEDTCQGAETIFVRRVGDDIQTHRPVIPGIHQVFDLEVRCGRILRNRFVAPERQENRVRSR